MEILYNNFTQMFSIIYSEQDAWFNLKEELSFIVYLHTSVTQNFFLFFSS